MQDIEQVAGPVTTYGHTLAALAEAAAESIGTPGSVRAVGSSCNSRKRRPEPLTINVAPANSGTSCGSFISSLAGK